MELLEKAEFKNRRNDKVKITLFADSFGGYHLITKVDMIRKTESTRVRNGSLIKLPISTHTQETKIMQIDNARTAEIEFRLECHMNAMPDFDFQSWLQSFDRTFNKEGK